MILFARLVLFLLAVIVSNQKLFDRPLFAGGFMIPHQSARALALGSAVTAGVRDASAVYYNPAALSEVEGNNLLLNGTYINVISSVENNGRTATNQHDDNYLATLFANYHIPRTDFTAGIGTYTPFGLATTYDSDFTRFAAERTELKTIYVTPAVSWHPSDYFSVGAGLSFVHASGLFSRALCLDPFTGCAAPGGLLEGRLRLTDTANAFAYNLGVLVKPTDDLKLGFSYRSRVDLRFDNADVKLGGAFSPSSVKAQVRPLPLPAVIDVGLSWQMNKSWGAELVYEYTRWSDFKTFVATFSPVPTFVPLGVPISGFTLPQDWKDTSALRLGSYYQLQTNWEIRGGMVLEQGPIPNRTLSLAIPGADLLAVSAGVGYKWQRLSVDLGYMAVFYKTRKVNNNELEGLPATGIAFSGVPGKDRYQIFNNLVALSFNYQF
jgi:long-chain fatty acid transport protein